MGIFSKLKNNGSASKDAQAKGPKYNFGESALDSDDTGTSEALEAHLRMQGRMNESGRWRRHRGSTTRHENEDPNANQLFDSVHGYKESLRQGDEKARPRQYEYPPDSVVRGLFKPAPREGEEKAAADKLFEGADMTPKQPLVSPEELEVAGRRIRALAAQASLLCGVNNPSSVRYKGEDPAADALFKSRIPRQETHRASGRPQIDGQQSSWKQEDMIWRTISQVPDL
jgi:hypothetical protein